MIRVSSCGTGKTSEKFAKTSYSAPFYPLHSVIVVLSLLLVATNI